MCVPQAVDGHAGYIALAMKVIGTASSGQWVHASACGLYDDLPFMFLSLSECSDAHFAWPRCIALQGEQRQRW